jgi:hypothetical protein
MRSFAELYVGSMINEKDFFKLPAGVQAALVRDNSINVDGLTIRLAISNVLPVGLGVELVNTSRVTEVALADLSVQASELAPKVQKIFETWGLKENVVVFLSTNTLV